MGFTDFIFSDKRTDRIKQHLLFWFIWYLYIMITHAANPLGYNEISYFRNPLFTLIESFFTVFAQVPTVYTMLYFVFPYFILKGKYMLSLAWIIVLWFLCGAFTLILLDKVMQPFLAMVLPSENMFRPPKIPGTSFLMAVMATNKGAYTIIASALMLKFGKHWYQTKHRNLQLQKENTEAQLQLLTAQVHPHFLFNTLNNIFSKTQTESPNGSRMIMSLSDMLRYILYEGQKQLVPLKQEFTMITEYIELEKMRFGDKTEAHILIPDRTDDIYIAPLLLLPFIENCFRPGTDDLLQNPWINLTIELKDTTLVMKLMNGKSTLRENNQIKPGIGFSNVLQRLDLLYKGKYEVQIREDEEVFVVDLQVQLVKVENTRPMGVVSKPESNISYA